MIDFRMDEREAADRNLWKDFWAKRGKQLCRGKYIELRLRCCRENGHESQGTEHAFIGRGKVVYWR